MGQVEFYVDAAFFTGEDEFVELYYERVKDIAKQFNGTLLTTASVGSGKDTTQIAKFQFSTQQSALDFQSAFVKEDNMSYCTLIESGTTEIVDATGGFIDDDTSSLDRFAHELGESIMQHVLEHHQEKSKKLDADTLILSLESVDKMYDTYSDEFISEEEDEDTEKSFTSLDMLKSYQSGVLDGISSSSALICGLTHPLLGDEHERLE